MDRQSLSISDKQGKSPVRLYSWYALGVLFLVYVLNFVDRQIISILADDIKRDLALKDEDLGFLYGTAFGVFYALFGIPLGRLADRWRRVPLMAAGITLWSIMTMFSGLSQRGSELFAARIGVGIGEATASPTAYSLISDWFPKRLRATALSIYSAGLYVGAGLSLFLGGYIAQQWEAHYQAVPPLGLAGWQAAFVAVGLPGIVLAIWVMTLREPVREPASDGESGLTLFVRELVNIIPPFTLIGAMARGAKGLAWNIASAVVIGCIVALLIGAGEAAPQWIAIGIGVYALFSWASALRVNDPHTYALVVASPAFLSIVAAYGFNTFLNYGASFWAAPYALRTFDVSRAEAGILVGTLGAIAGLLGVALGGIAADRLGRKQMSGRLWTVIVGATVPPVAVIVAFTADSLLLFCVALFIAQAASAAALGGAAAATQELVLPRMRGTATAAFLVGATLLGLAMGPYAAGRVSTLSGDLATGVLALTLIAPLTLAAAIAAFRLVPAAEARLAKEFAEQSTA